VPELDVQSAMNWRRLFHAGGPSRDGKSSVSDRSSSRKW